MALTVNDIQEVRLQTLQLISQLRDVRQEINGILTNTLHLQNERYANRVRMTEAALSRGLEDGNHDVRSDSWVCLNPLERCRWQSWPF